MGDAQLMQLLTMYTSNLVKQVCDKASNRDTHVLKNNPTDLTIKAPLGFCVLTFGKEEIPERYVVVELPTTGKKGAKSRHTFS